MWNMLVPGSGKAQTIQGEMIWIIGRITHEILDNVGLNWDDDNIEMIHALNEFLNLNKESKIELIEEAGDTIKDITISTDKKTLYRLTEIIVQWVLEFLRLQSIAM